MRKTRHLEHLKAVACVLGLSISAFAWSTVLSQSPPRVFEEVGVYSPTAGNTDGDINATAGFNPVPYLWRFDPMTNGIPSARARNTYIAQEAGATANPPSAWRAFFAYQDSATVLGGNPGNAHDISNTLAWFENQNYAVDYVFADFEGTNDDWSNISDLYNQVRNSPVGAKTVIGNFGWFSGAINLGAVYPHSADLRAQSAQFATNASNGMVGLNMSMPVGYPVQAFMLHADDTYSWGEGWWANSLLPSSAISLLTYNQQAAIGSTYLSPNERAGIFYGPLEQVSLAARNLPVGQQLIPWVSAFQQTIGVPNLQPGQVATPADNAALLEHCRLRGAVGLSAFGDEGTPAYTGTYSDGTTFTVASYHAYAAEAAAAWHSMDWFFALPTQVGTMTADRPLNLYTFKNTGGTYVDSAGRNGGIEWSAYQRGNRILALISNLGNSAQAAVGTGTGKNGNWQSVFASLSARLPAQSPTIPAGNHLIVEYLTDPAVTDFNAYAVNSVLGAAQGWNVSNPNFVVTTAAGTGDGRNQAIAIVHSAATAWFANATTANPGGIGATANDRMMYSFRVFTGWTGSGSAAFAPVVGSGTSVPVSAQHNGPTVWVYTGGAQNYWAFGSNYGSGGPYHATNATPAANTWYEIEMIVDPSTDLATIYVLNLSVGNGSWTLLRFGTSTSVTAGLIPGEETPSLYDGYQISGPAGTQFDNVSAELYPYPPSPVSTYTPAQPTPPLTIGSAGADSGGADGPMPTWALLAVAAAIIGVASRRLPCATN